MASQKFSPGYVKALGAMHHVESLGTAETSDPVLIGARFRNVSIGIGGHSGGSAKVQYTLDTIANVEADAADWVDWASGDVAAGTNAAENLEGPVTAVRGVMNTGASGEWYVIADTNE